MNDSMPMATDLSDAGMNMTNYTVAYNFLQDILDYTGFQPMNEAISRAFWYGIVIVIAIAAIANFIQRATLHARFVPHNSFSNSILEFGLLLQTKFDLRVLQIYLPLLWRESPLLSVRLPIPKLRLSDRTGSRCLLSEQSLCSSFTSRLFWGSSFTITTSRVLNTMKP